MPRRPLPRPSCGPSPSAPTCPCRQARHLVARVAVRALTPPTLAAAATGREGCAPAGVCRAQRRGLRQHHWSHPVQRARLADHRCVARQGGRHCPRARSRPPMRPAVRRRKNGARADVGCPQLSMHSIRETGGANDVQHAITLFKVGAMRVATRRASGAASVRPDRERWEPAWRGCHVERRPFSLALPRSMPSSPWTRTCCALYRGGGCGAMAAPWPAPRDHPRGARSSARHGGNHTTHPPRRSLLGEGGKTQEAGRRARWSCPR